MREKGGKRGSGRSVLAVQHDDDVCVYTYISRYVYFNLRVCMIHVLFNFGLDLSINFFSFI